MSKKRGLNDSLQMDFLALFDAPMPPKKNEVGGFDFDAELRVLLNKAIKEYKAHSGNDRFTLAAELSRITNTEVTKNNLDTWTGASRTLWRFPLHLLPAFITVTGSVDLLNTISGKCGFAVMSHADAKAARVGRLRDLQKEVNKKLKEAEQEFSSGKGGEF